jgi:hypothetical protein
MEPMLTPQQFDDLFKQNQLKAEQKRRADLSECIKDFNRFMETTAAQLAEKGGSTQMLDVEWDISGHHHLLVPGLLSHDTKSTSKMLESLKTVIVETGWKLGTCKDSKKLRIQRAVVG